MADRDIIRKFLNRGEAETFAGLLSRNGIACEVKKTKPLVDTIIAGDDQENTFNVLIDPADFTKANALIDGIIAGKLDELPDDYYLYQFTDEELIEVINKADEWSNQDVQLAKKMLSDRGKGLSEESLREMKMQRYKELAKPAGIDNLTLAASYFLAVFFCPIGLFLSLFYLNTKTTLPDGVKVYGYDERSRGHAKTTLTISVVILIFLVLATILKNR